MFFILYNSSNFGSSNNILGKTVLLKTCPFISLYSY